MNFIECARLRECSALDHFHLQRFWHRKMYITRVWLPFLTSITEKVSFSLSDQQTHNVINLRLLKDNDCAENVNRLAKEWIGSQNMLNQSHKWNDYKIASSKVNETIAKGHRTSGQSTHLGDNSKWLRNGRAVPCNSKSHFSIFDNKMINAVIYWILKSNIEVLHLRVLANNSNFNRFKFQCKMNHW